MAARVEGEADAPPEDDQRHVRSNQGRDRVGRDVLVVAGLDGIQHGVQDTDGIGRVVASLEGADDRDVLGVVWAWVTAKDDRAASVDMRSRPGDGQIVRGLCRALEVWRGGRRASTRAATWGSAMVAASTGQRLGSTVTATGAAH